MNEIVLQPSIQSHWHALVSEAEAKSKQTLNEEMESYLVFLLMRFTEKTDLATKVLALEFLNGLNEHRGKLCEQKLREVGDSCLILAGLFPERALHKRVDLSYFINIGQSSYQALSQLTEQKIAQMYAGLCETFKVIMEIMNQMRYLNPFDPQISGLTAFDLWQHTGNGAALDNFSHSTVPILNTPTTLQ
jgi:hypothetical protein